MTQIATTHDRPRFTFAQMRTFLEIGWGSLGMRIAAHWIDYNERYFDGDLEPV